VTDPRWNRPTAGKLPLTVVKPAGKAAYGVLIATQVLGAGLFLTIVAAFAGKPGVSPVLLVIQLAIALLLLVTAFLLVLWLLRNRAWLEGTTLVVRTTYRTRRCDLATDPVRLGYLLWVKCLLFRESMTGRPARLALGPLTGPELAAVADAITARGRRDPGAWQVVATLRQRAAQRQWEAGWQPAGPPGVPPRHSTG
jgi:hypothetical protein